MIRCSVGIAALVLFASTLAVVAGSSASEAGLLPIAYLGSATEDDFGTLCKFQVVAVIDSPCWSKASAPAHSICTNNTNEEDRIIAISSKLKEQCPSVSTQMYLNSLMDFYWYGLHREFEGANASLLLHDIYGHPVTVNQDGGAGPQPVWDWGQAETKAKYMALVDRALASGISSFFLDKASTFTRNGTQLCNHVCANLSEAVGAAWDAGHLEVLRAIQAKSPGPTVGNTGFNTCAKMGGCVQEKVLQASQQGIQELAETLAQPTTKAAFAHFPMSTAGYAAFLMAHQEGKSWLWWYNGKPTYSGWIPEFNHTLGAPVGNATLSGGVYTRAFTTGTVVTFNTATNTGTFSWPPSPTPPSPSPPPPPPPPPPSPPAPSPLPPQCGEPIPNTAFSHIPSIGTKVTNDAAGCCAYCNTAPQCTVWSWWRQKGGLCHLQTDAAVSKHISGCTSGRLVNRTATFEAAAASAATNSQQAASHTLAAL